MKKCPSCEKEIASDSSYCASCGHALSDSNSNIRNRGIDINDPNPPVGFVKSMIYKLVPGLDSSLYYKNLMGGCPACGEGKEINIESNSRILGSSAAPDYDMACTRCGTKMQSDGRWMKVTESEEWLEGSLFSESETQLLSKYKRQGKDDKYEDRMSKISDKERSDEITDKSISIISRVYYYPIALVLFTAGIRGGGGAENVIFGTILAGFALPEVRTRLADWVGFSLPWSGKLVFAAVYGFLALLFFIALLIPS